MLVALMCAVGASHLSPHGAVHVCLQSRWNTACTNAPTVGCKVAIPKAFRKKFEELEDNKDIVQPRPFRVLSIARGPGFSMHVHGTAVFVLVQGEVRIRSLWTSFRP